MTQEDLQKALNLALEGLERIANPTDSTYGNPQFIALKALAEIRKLGGGV